MLNQLIRMRPQLQEHSFVNTNVRSHLFPVALLRFAQQFNDIKLAAIKKSGILFGLIWAAILLFPGLGVAQSYTITTTGNAIVITDVAGNGETLTVSESGDNIRFVVSPSTSTYAINGGAITAFTTPADVALAGAVSITINTAAGNDTINIGTFAANLPTLTINGGTGNDAVHFNGSINFAANAHLDVDMQNDDATPGDDRVTVAANAKIILSGTGTATVKVSHSMLMNSGSSIKTENGHLTLEANQQATATAGDFVGISLNGAVVECTGTGALTLKGRGGTSGSGKHGIRLTNAAKVQGGTGKVSVAGKGGNTTGNSNYGVYVDGANSKITSFGGAVHVNGTGGGSGSSQFNNGVNVISGGEITAGGTGSVSVEGQGGYTTGSNSSINYGVNYGVNVRETNSKITSSGGSVEVIGTGGGGSSSSNYGVSVQTGGEITAGGTGSVSVVGNGGNSTGNANNGVVINGANAKITSSGGNVHVNGTGGGSASSVLNYGVYVLTGGEITAGGKGSVNVDGKGGNSTGNANDGVVINGTNAKITAEGGDVHVTGTGGGSENSNANHSGVAVRNGGEITAGATGSVSVDGKGGNAMGTNFGVVVETNSKITSSGGNVYVNGTSSASSNSNFAVYVVAGGEITAGATGSVSVVGNGGTKGGGNVGVVVRGTNSKITSSGGDVEIKGTGSSGSLGFNFGVYVQNGGEITAGGMGSVSIEGQGGNGIGLQNYGVYVIGTNAKITSSGGDVEINGTGGGSGNSHSNYGVWVRLGGVISAGGTGTVNVVGNGGNTTGINNYGVYIEGSNAKITSSAGDVEVKGTGSGSAADILLESGGMITSTSTTAGITLHSTNNGTWPNTAGADVSTASTQTTTFGTGSKFNITINGLTVNTQYQQLGVVGMIDLNGAELTFAGSTYTPESGDIFTIVDNDGADAIIGTFNGLPEGATIPDFLGSGLCASITYTGGDGNDVVITVNCEPALPLSNLLTFTAQREGKSGLLKWSTTPVHPFATFQVQKSDDGVQFAPLATVAAQSSQLQYMAYDHNLLPGMRYYQLHITEKDGTILYSEVRSLKGEGEQPGTKVYPNPVVKGRTLTIVSNGGKLLSLRLFHTDGRVITARDNMQENSINTSMQLPAGLASGVYLLQVHTNKGVEVHKVMVE